MHESPTHPATAPHLPRARTRARVSPMPSSAATPTSGSTAEGKQPTEESTGETFADRLRRQVADARNQDPFGRLQASRQ